MSFISFSFFGLFLPAVMLLYYLMPNVKWQNRFLLLSSVFFYSLFDYKYVVLLLYSAMVTFLGGRYVYITLQQGKRQQAKRILAVSLVLNVAPLIFFKYIGVISGASGLLFSSLGIAFRIPKFLFPVGLSFFIFQSTTYLLDLYHGKTELESDWANYALFVSFFPTIVSGPIQRSAYMLPALRKKRTVSWNRLQSAFLVFLWGIFVKLVVADRLAVFTETLFGNYSDYGFFMLTLAVVAYSVQIYADFYGYSMMAAGTARFLGFDLRDNFRQPYMAVSVAEFWRRWHISLSTWFRDYIYIPLGGSRKGKIRKYINLTVVFLISGVWHGSTWNYVIWGGLHAVYQILGYLTEPVRLSVFNRLEIKQNTFSYTLWRRFCVSVAIGFSWIFFRLSVGDAFGFIVAMLTKWDLESIFLQMPKQLGLDGITIFAVLLFAGVSVCRERGYTCQNVVKQNYLFRLLCYLFLILFTLLFGSYGPAFSSNAFIYMDF